MKNSKKVQDAVIDTPVYWFTLMELGKGHGDFAQAAQAKAQLERLGVWVQYRPIRTTREFEEVHSHGC